MIRLLAAAMFAAAMLSSPVVRAHGSEDGHDDSKDLLDCQRLPAKALKVLPAPLDRWARLECVPTGQMLVQGRQWAWRYPASFTTPVHIPAWSFEPAAAAEDSLYFVSADVAHTSGEAAATLEGRLTRDVVVYTAMNEGKQAVRDIYTLTARNSAGHQFDVHFLYRSDEDIWGLVCAPECRSDFSFILESREK